MEECQKAFQDLKAYLTATPLLSPSIPGEELYLYLAVSLHAVSSVLIREEGKIQKLIYYASRALRGAKWWYPMMEKLAFALVTASSKLRHYFQAYVINVLIDHPLKKAMNKLESARRLIQWAIKLSDFDVWYQPISVIKAQVLADFIAEFTPNQGELDEVNKTQRWIVNMDGSSTLYARGIGVILKSQKETSWSMQLVYNTKPPIMKLNMKLFLTDWNWLSL